MCALLVVMLILGMGMVSISAPSLPKIFVDPPTYYGTVLGEIFTIDISIFNITNMGVFEFYFGYNTTLLDILDVVVGPFPPHPDLHTLDMNDTTGYVRMAVTCNPVNGSGTLATITFNATYAESASSTLDLYNTVFGDWIGDPISHEVEDGYYEFLTAPITVATDKPTYQPEENVTIHGNVTLPFEGLLALTVDNPDNLGLVLRTLQRGATPPPGDIEIIAFYPSDSQGNPYDNFTRGGMIFPYFTVYVKNNGTEWKTVLIAVNAYDGNMVPLLPVQSFKTLIAPSQVAVMIAGIYIPAWAHVGTGTAYASALTDYPKNGGTPYIPEKSTTFNIIDGGGGGGGTPETPGSGNISAAGNYSFTIKLPPNATTGGYRVYAGFSSPGYHVASSTVFGVNTIIVPDHYSTIQEAVDAATPTNNTILVLPGTYNENVNINVNINTSLTLVATDPSVTVINGSGTGSVVTIVSDNVEVSRFTIQNSGSSSTDSGILLQNSSGSTIQGNIITSSEYGINAHSSSNIFILDNTLSNNNHGIYLNYTTSSTLRKNNMISNNYNFAVLGDSLSDFTHVIDTTNTVEGNPIYYWINQIDRQVPANAGFIALVNSVRITLRDLDLKKNVQGILFAFTDDSLIERVNTMNNEYGIYLVQSFGNTIVGSTISNNVVGIYMKNSNASVICHNNFTDNTNQVELHQSSNIWDDSAGKGNYWSNYTGADDGSNNRTIGDGVGDTDLPHLGVDWYPLMSPRILMHDIAITNVTHLLPRSDVTHAYPGWMITIIATIKNEGDFTETSFPITAYYDGIPAKTKIVSELAPQKEAIIDLIWDTTGISPGNYTLNATVDSVPGETAPDQADNTLVDGTVKFNRLGDINSDGNVNVLDVKLVKLAYSGLIELPPADINGDGDIDILDVKRVKLAYSGLIG